MSRWLPDGKRHGQEYVVRNPTRVDSKLGSFSINLNTGAWADFASSDKGGDLVALVAYLDGTKQGEAAKRLAEFLGMDTGKQAAPQHATSAQGKAATTAPPKADKPQWDACCPCQMTRHHLAPRTRSMASIQCAGNTATLQGSCCA
ncbi:MAG: hypothetical protein WDM70_02025 [Nitrosomonadales bacterium]